LASKTPSSVSILIIARSHHIVWEAPTQRHTLLLIDKQGVLFDLDVPLQALLVADEILEGVVGLTELILQPLDALGDLGDLLDELDVGLIVAGLHVWASGAFLEARLSHAQRRIFRRDIGLETLYVFFLFGYFLKWVQWGINIEKNYEYWNVILF
jgi:hypothetical protein